MALIRPTHFLMLSSMIMLMGGAFAVAPHFPTMPIPRDNPQSADKIELGRQLFFDKRLSADDTLSCSNCHIQKFAFSNAPNRVSTGIRGQKGTRNAPGLGNIGYRRSWFWEGGAKSLELQAMGPITAHDEMGMEPDVLVRKLKGVPAYVEHFARVFPDGITMLNITRAIASFERTLITDNSPWDRYRQGDEKALSPAALRGMDLFFGEKGDCFHCHNGFNFTDEQLHNTGVHEVYKDEGLARITKNPADVGKFKTPSLRNLPMTAPYMHDGSMKTLQDVLNHYNKGGQPNENADLLMRPLNLSKQDMNDLIMFLSALSDTKFVTDPRFGPPAKQY